MIRVRIIAELPEDETGLQFAQDAGLAQNRIPAELATGYAELPRYGATGPIPVTAETVREVVVWEGRASPLANGHPAK